MVVSLSAPTKRHPGPRSRGNHTGIPEIWDVKPDEDAQAGAAGAG